jgi:crotonobetainyl-CoA:carnitine CoA-transferase CaiB-like acyl-CoA transferase
MRPLSGIRVLDLTHVYAAPFATYQLGVMGADVIKIEPVGMPDMTRDAGVDYALNERGYGLDFQAHAGGKRALAVDLKSAEGRALFHDMVMQADVVVQNYATHCLVDLGLDYETLCALNPRLVYCSVSAYGRTGPKANDPAYDFVIQAYAGVMASNGEPDGAPLRIGPPVIDYATGLQAAMAICAVLFDREKTGRGRYIDLSMTDAALMLMTANVVTTEATGRAPRPVGNVHPHFAGYSAYDTAQGTLVIGAYTARQNADLMRVLGNDHAAEALRVLPHRDLSVRRDEDNAFLTRKLRERTADDWELLLNMHHVPAARVRTIDETLAEPQVAERGMMQDVDRLDAPRRLPVAAFSMDHGTPKLDGPPPRYGQDSAAILAEMGLSATQIADLAARGIIATDPNG